MTKAQTLLQLFQKYNSLDNVEYPTDKNSYHTYIEDVYEEYLKPYRNKKINLLEIGVAWSGSIRLWNDYFKYAKIYGVDNFSCGIEYRNKSLDLIEGSVKRVSIIEQNAYLKETANSLPDFDIIIDDGPHTLYSQTMAIELYLPKLKSGGIMFIEDIPVDFEHDLKEDNLELHPLIQPLLNKIPNGKYEYKIFDLRCSPSEKRGDNVILAIQYAHENNNLGISTT